MDYLEHAMSLDIYLSSDYHKINGITDYLYEKIEKEIKIRKKNRTKQMLKLIIINLWVAHKQGVAIRYSRNRNAYSSAQRYGKLHFKYRIVVNIFDTLEMLGFIDHRIGFFDRKKGIGRVTRASMTPKMVKLFEEMDKGLVYKTPPVEIIQLKDEKKTRIDYEESPLTIEMRGNLDKYNEFMSKQRIDIILPSHTKVSDDFITKFRINLLKGVISINEIYYMHESDQLINFIPGHTVCN